MLNYKELVSNVFEIIKEIENYNLDRLETILEKEKIYDKSLLKNWRNLTEQVCYDKQYCKLLGVDYINLPQNDFKKINVFTLYLLKKNKNFIHPFLD